MVESKVEKRNRPPKSCEPCRIRKLKCNRELPCDACIRGSRSTSCQYAANADRNEKRSSMKTVSGRLKKLEDLILKMASPNSLLEDGNEDASPANTPVSREEMDTDANEDLASHNRVLSNKSTEPLSGGLLYNSHSSYIDSSHWSSLLEEIKEIRDQLASPNSDEQPSLGTNASTTGTDWPPAEETYADLVIVQTGTPNLQEIVMSLPSRAVCDRLVSHYFRLAHAILPVLHPMKFQQEYALFWEAQVNAPPVWVALLFAILGVAAGLYKVTGTETSGQSLPQVENMAEKARQCLALGSYVNTDKYSLEALIVLLQSHYFYASDTKPNLWFLMGVVIRLAIRRGYHRDPSKLPNSQLSPFEAEMRRRVWVNIFQIDSLVSFQMGLPSMIPSEYCDTELPRNLEYSDLDPDMPSLPPSRPVSDMTSILYTILKARIMSVFKSIVGHTRSLAPLPYTKTMSLDSELRLAYDNLPAYFKYKPLRQCLIDSAGIIMNRATIELLYLKSIIVLHRRYIKAYRHNTLYDISRRACLEACCIVLDRQAELFRATQDGGLLHDSKWMISALSTNDFILAAMVLCLELTISIQEHKAHTTKEKGPDGDSGRYISAIKTAHQIWLESSTYSAEAMIAASAIGSTIRRTEAQRKMQFLSWSPSGQNSASSTGSEAHEALLHVEPTPALMDEMDYINWDFLDNDCHDPLNEGLDLNSWMLDAAKVPDLTDFM